MTALLGLLVVTMVGVLLIAFLSSNLDSSSTILSIVLASISTVLALFAVLLVYQHRLLSQERKEKIQAIETLSKIEEQYHPDVVVQSWSIGSDFASVTLSNHGFGAAKSFQLTVAAEVYKSDELISIVPDLLNVGMHRVSKREKDAIQPSESDVEFRSEDSLSFDSDATSEIAQYDSESIKYNVKLEFEDLIDNQHEKLVFTVDTPSGTEVTNIHDAIEEGFTTVESTAHTKGDSQPTILFVDDEKPLADLFATWLSDEYETIPVYSGQEAIEHLEDADLVFVDRRLPEMSGDRIAEVARERGYDIPIVALSAVDPSPEILDVPFDDYLLKPMARDVLIEEADRLLEIRDFSNEFREYFRLQSLTTTLRTHGDVEELEEDERYLAAVEKVREMEEDLDINQKK
ncbi:MULTISPECIES: response regulator [Halobacterium]|uniref:response regulator n=1 Tax=Halobacterium TaxID=2239 RepID=UPI0018D25E6F|nr:response regulator [Halobacterium sp. CBA1132]MCG1004431.1 response regulator [Halobacterium noricense]